MKIFAACILLAGAASACADATGPAATQRQALAKPATTFGYLDIDKDQRLSLQEARADWAVAAGFAAADRNHDGYLDAEEFKLVGRG